MMRSAYPSNPEKFEEVCKMNASNRNLKCYNVMEDTTRMIVRLNQRNAMFVRRKDILQSLQIEKF